ncbi:MAG: hypothetical protein ABJR46_06340 [Tateyamaria sp.]|uniref:hypothetical protein n=1 Tax=Tateyamaria sp. TaxID=1929288 RepID=UPI0032A005C7
MRITNDTFKPLGGELSAHLFENHSTGLSRDLYWGIDFDFQPFKISGRQEHPNCLVDWLKIPDAQAALKNPLFLSDTAQPHAEATCYIETQHNTAVNWEFNLTPSAEADTWDLDYALTIVGDGLEFTAAGPLELFGKTSLKFSSLIIVKENLVPKITTIEQARQAIAPFFETTELDCRDEDWRYTFPRRK